MLYDVFQLEELLKKLYNTCRCPVVKELLDKIQEDREIWQYILESVKELDEDDEISNS